MLGGFFGFCSSVAFLGFSSLDANLSLSIVLFWKAETFEAIGFSCSFLVLGLTKISTFCYWRPNLSPPSWKPFLCPDLSLPLFFWLFFCGFFGARFSACAWANSTSYWFCVPLNSEVFWSNLGVRRSSIDWFSLFKPRAESSWSCETLSWSL